MSQTDLIDKYCDYLATQKRYSQNTVSSYFNDLAGLKRYLKEQYDLNDPVLASNQMLRSWLSFMKEQKLESRSINRKLSAVRSFFKYLLRMAVVEKSPTEGIRALKTTNYLPVFLEVNQIKELLNRSFFPRGFDGDTDFLLISLFYNTGMRVSELATLKISDVDFSAGIISVIGKGNKQRNVPLSEEMAIQIKDYVSIKRKLFSIPSDTLIASDKNERLSRTTIYKRVHRMLAEITTIQKKSPHVLRHTFATHLSDQGAPIGAIKDLLGHSSLAATQIYTHTGIARLKEIYKKAHPKS